MAKAILSINAGSSSVKISVYRLTEGGQAPQRLVETQVGGLTAPPATFSYESQSQKIKEQLLDKDIASQDDAFKYILDHLIEDRKGVPEIRQRADIVAACHRIVHGGDYDDAQVITSDTYHRLEALTDLAPLHNAPALSIVQSCLKQLPNTRNVAFFDSAFHHTIPDHIRTYPIDPEIATKNKLRKYGFHGISYSFIVRSVAAYLGKPVEKTNIIALHLGSGASACAIRGGKSMDTSMGLTPLAGLPGATRSGSVDPSLVFHFTSDGGKPSPNSTENMHISTAEEILNKKSGWKALTGTTDFKLITSQATGTPPSSSFPSSSTSADNQRFNKQCRLAYAMFVDRIANYIGSYVVPLDGCVDALVFAGGIGEKSASLRKSVVEKVTCLGFSIDDRLNADPINQRRPGDEQQAQAQAPAPAPAPGEGKKEEKPVVVGIDGLEAGKRTLICWTDEQYEMARQYSLRHFHLFS